MKTDLVALTKALATANPQAIHAVLFPTKTDDDVSRRVTPGVSTDRRTAPTDAGDPLRSVESPDDACRPLAAHFLRRMAHAIERGYRIDADEVPVLLDFLFAYQPTLRPKD
jgi:lysyl-tRNA synthetase class I